MILQNDFENYFQKEHKALSRNNLYVVYQFLYNQNNNIEIKFKFTKDYINTYDFLLEQELLESIKQMTALYSCYNYYFDFQKLMFNFQEDSMKELSKFFYEKTSIKKSRYDLENYIRIILHHLIPIDTEIIEYYNDIVKKILKKEKFKSKIVMRKESGGIYGIYENDILVYIGMTTRPFKVRWQEHEERIKNKSNELALYSLIDTNAKIEFKKLLERDKMECNDEITTRDLKAMEFALIQEHKPKYNFAGRSQPYQF